MDKYKEPIKDLNDLVIAAYRNKSTCLSTIDNYFSNSKTKIMSELENENDEASYGSLKVSYPGCPDNRLKYKTGS